jgi:hypothetical protein
MVGAAAGCQCRALSVDAACRPTSADRSRGDERWPDSPDDALGGWHALADDPRSLYIDAAPSSHEPYFESYVAGRQPTPNLWTDAWLAALAKPLNCELTTFDRGFKSFKELRMRLLTIEADS